MTVTIECFAKMHLLLVFTLILKLASATDLVTLYGPEDSVVELIDANVTSVYGSDKAWVVEFYAHWCGHCQRFVPTWIKLADKFKEWPDEVVVSALNCAEQEACADFGIEGTPTIRLFLPNAEQGEQGLDLRAHSGGATGLAHQIINHIDKTRKTQKGVLPTFPKVETFEPESSVSIANYVTSNLPKKTAFILDPSPSSSLGPDSVRMTHAQTPPGGLAKLVALEMGKEGFQASDMVLVGVPPTSASAFRHHFSGPMFLPSVIVMSSNWGSNDIFFPIVTNSAKEVETQIAEYLEGLGKRGDDDSDDEFHSLTSTTTTPSPVEEFTTEAPHTSTYSPPASTLSPVGASNLDRVYASDLEKAVQYALTNEILNHPVIDSEKLSALYMFLESLSKYLPVREEVKDFIISLREWPIKMGLTSITSESLKDKIDELERLYHPFEGTPDNFIGCRGSSPHLRGYPCSLWVTFHTMMTNAALQGDPAMTFRGPSTVARAMVGYIHHFFSCRHCAKNFALKVQTLGFLPATPKDSMLWLWQIHNMANQKLKGDPTEDPEHPKIVWPSAANCPECRVGSVVDLGEGSGGDPGVPIQGQLWKIESLANYLVKVYRKENVVPNNARSVRDRQREAEIEELKRLMGDTMRRLQRRPSAGEEDRSGFGRALDEDEDDREDRSVGASTSEKVDLKLNLHNLMVINEYCSNLMDRLEEDRK